MYKIYCQLKEKKNVTDYQVAKDTGIPRSTFSEWKTGRYTPKNDKLQKIADYFGVTLEYLMTGEDRNGYYLDEETAKKAQELFDNPSMRILFDAARDSRPEDLQMAADLLKRLKESNPNG